ncbi:MAG: hypothetical protein WC734_05310 [Patescibacteria group bacterium]
MKIKVSQPPTVSKIRLIPQARFSCPRCWTVSRVPGRCACGSDLAKERYRIKLQYETQA